MLTHAATIEQNNWNKEKKGQTIIIILPSRVGEIITNYDSLSHEFVV